MIWIIASIPFWISGALLGILGLSAVSYGVIRSSKIPQKEFNQGVFGALIAMMFSGIFFLLAAKICS